MKRIIEWVYYRFYQKYIKEWYKSKCQIFFNETFFNEILCGFRKAHSTQHASFELITSWQTSLRRGRFVGPILMDLSKAYDCLKDDLLLAYGFNKNI